jgi:hypothetical protein
LISEDLSSDLSYIRGRLDLNHRSLSNGAKAAFKVFDQPEYQYTYLRKVKDGQAVDGMNNFT